MAKTKRRETTARRSATVSSRKIASMSRAAHGRSVVTGATAALEDARDAGLLEGGKTTHVSFRAPPALVEAAKRESGATSGRCAARLAI